MYKAIVFAGTTEGYALCEFLAENRVSVYVQLQSTVALFLKKMSSFMSVQEG